MKMNLYSIYDQVTEVFNKPFTEHNDNSARRAFEQSISKSPSKDDYCLYHIGSYNDANAEIETLRVPNKVSSGFDLKQPSAIMEAVGD